MKILEKDGFYGWFSLGGAALAYFLMSGAVSYSFGVFLPSLCQEFGWSRGAVSGASTAMFVVAGLCAPLAGWYVAKYGARLAIVTGAFISAVGFLFLAFHSQVWQLYVAYGSLVGLGLGIGGLIPATTIANNWFDKKRSLAMGIVMASGGLGPILLIPQIMAVINRLGWRITYLVLFGVMVFLALVPGIVLRSRPEDLGQVPDGSLLPESKDPGSGKPPSAVYKTPVDFTAREAFRTPSFWLVTAYAFTQMFGASVVIAHQVAFLMDMGIAAGVAATAFGLIPGMSGAGRLGSGFLGLRFSPRSLGIWSTGLMVVSLVLLLAAGDYLPVIFISSIFYGLGFGSSVVAFMNLYPTYFGRKHYPQIIGYASPLLYLGSFGAPFAGRIYDAMGNYMVAYVALILILVGGIVCLWVGRPPLHPSLKR